jgi:hypothetical protein
MMMMCYPNSSQPSPAQPSPGVIRPLQFVKRLHVSKRVMYPPPLASAPPLITHPLLSSSSHQHTINNAPLRLNWLARNS